ncbi:MAG: hypothetical protein M3Q88_04230 [Pseudomonadota bacterium]|nr:hypothetical protein [Pseudomonadota bacterium]
MSQGMIFVLLIVSISIIGGILKARYGHRGGHHDDRRERDLSAHDDGETRRLKEEVRALKDRLQVLERITVEKESSLNREIDQLRDR